MTTIISSTSSQMNTIASKLGALFGLIVEAFDNLATYRMQRTMPELNFAAAGLRWRSTTIATVIHSKSTTRQVSQVRFAPQRIVVD